MTGIVELDRLIASLKPELLDTPYVFCTVQGPLETYLSLQPVATFCEREGLTLVLNQAHADHAGLSYDGRFRCITLSVHSSLDAVGLTAAVSAALTEANISANVIAAYYHDHVFVPEDKAEMALEVLVELADTHH